MEGALVSTFLGLVQAPKYQSAACIWHLQEGPYRAPVAATQPLQFTPLLRRPSTTASWRATFILDQHTLPVRPGLVILQASIACSASPPAPTTRYSSALVSRPSRTCCRCSPGSCVLRTSNRPPPNLSPHRPSERPRPPATSTTWPHVLRPVCTLRADYHTAGTPWRLNRLGPGQLRPSPEPARPFVPIGATSSHESTTHLAGDVGAITSPLFAPASPASPFSPPTCRSRP